MARRGHLAKKEAQNWRLRNSLDLAAANPVHSMSDYFTRTQAMYLAKDKGEPSLGTVMKFVKWYVSEIRFADALGSLASSLHSRRLFEEQDGIHTGLMGVPTRTAFVAMLQGRRPIPNDVKIFIWNAMLDWEQQHWEARPDVISDESFAEARARQEEDSKPRHPVRDHRHGQCATVRTSEDTARASHFNQRGTGVPNPAKTRRTHKGQSYEIWRQERIPAFV